MRTGRPTTVVARPDMRLRKAAADRLRAEFKASPAALHINLEDRDPAAEVAPGLRRADAQRFVEILRKQRAIWVGRFIRAAFDAKYPPGSRAAARARGEHVERPPVAKNKRAKWEGQV